MRRSWRWLVLGVTALLALGLVTALAAPTLGRTSLDPDAATPGGTRALAELLRDEGVTVERTTDAERSLTTGSSTTLVIAYPELLRRQDVQRLEGLASDVVMLGPVVTGNGYLGTVPSEPVAVQVRQPVCDLPAAVRSGDARTGGVGFVAVDSAPVTTTAECFPAGDAPTLVQRITASGATHTVVGSAEFMTNEWLDEAGNASLALSLTGQNTSVVWWLPTPVYSGRQSLTSLLPDGVWPLLAMASVIVIALAGWRGRRLGPLVVEPLPVAVRASETTEGRARIYQRYRTHDRAAEHLRAQTTDAIITRIGIPPSAPTSSVVDAVAQITGRRSDEVRAVLYGPPPEGDQALVSLGRQLATLEQEVRRA